MKKATAPCRILSITLILLFSFLLQARVTISKIEYFPGEDFVQLHMQTDKILPIPDIFYPQKDNLNRLVMRIKDVDFKVDNHFLTFDSPVIQELNIKQAGDFSDVEIKLKGEVNYRVFTNQTGLYIEFPVIKELASRPEKAIVAPDAASVKAAVNTPVQQTPARTAATGSRPINIREVKLAGREPDRVRFDFVLTGKTKYRVIPIEQHPVRLAIDLQNAQSKRISKTVNIKNVKGIRGANNSPAVYRIVFDLDYLKHFSVQANDNLLQVEFFDEPAADAVVPAMAQNQKPETKPQAVAAAPIKTATADVDTPRPQTTVAQAQAAAAEKPASPAREFFGTEKSQADNEPMKKEDELGIQEVAETVPEDNSYVKKTVDLGRSQFSGDPYDFSFKNADISNLLKFIAKISGLNMVIDPDVTGRFTCELIQVPWDQALELILKVNGLDMIQEGNILRIGKVDKLAAEAKQRQALKEARLEEGNLEVSTRTLSYARATDLMPILKKQMSPRGELIVDERTNTLIISEVPEKIKIVDSLIDTLDAANPQVQIEARIVEATTSALDAFGIQWGYNAIADAAHGNQTNLVFPNSISSSGTVEPTLNPMGYAINIPAASSVVSPRISLGNIAGTFNIDVALSALTRKGKGRLISSPRATTQNNMPAEITQGQKIPIQTNQNNTITTQYINAALEMKVTPQITARGSVIMQIDIKNDVPNYDRQVQEIPTIVTETVKTTVMVNDGGTIVIGGLYKTSLSTSSDGVPLLSKIPLLGSLFRNSKKTGDQQELIIFITPRIIK
ncbi:MAG: type IV pilus secretin PilQ [Candidatus Aminicenantes bacterium]|nr:type IV pilus secretin PilQ [Candidatus Aminicenantes bacterium]